MKLINIVEAKETLEFLNNLLLPVKQSLQIMQVTDKFNKHIEHYCKHKDKMLLKYGESEDGIKYKIKSEFLEVYNKELYDLDNTEIDIEKEKISLNSNIVIKPSNLKQLRKILDIEVV